MEEPKPFDAIDLTAGILAAIAAANGAGWLLALTVGQYWFRRSRWSADLAEWFLGEHFERAAPALEQYVPGVKKALEAPRKALPAPAHSPVAVDDDLDEPALKPEPKPDRLVTREPERPAPPPEPRALPTIVRLRDYTPPTSTSVLIGIDEQQRPHWADIRDGILHTGIYATSGGGKDTVLRSWFVSLAERNDPSTLQFAILDGKNDWLGARVQRLAHCWFEPKGGYGEAGRQAILAGIEEIDAEAARRSELFRRADCISWDEYNSEYPHRALPLLVVIATDVTDSFDVPEIERLLTYLVSKARALGIRVIVSMQTPTGGDMRWRANLSLVMAGALIDGTQDGPALGLRQTKDLSVRPSHLPPPPAGAGQFVVREGGALYRVKAPTLGDLSDFRRAVQHLPVRPTEEDRVLASLLEVLPGSSREVTAEVRALPEPSEVLPPQQNAVEVLPAPVRRRTIVQENTRSLLESLSAEEREVLPRLLRAYLQNGRSTTSAIREVYGVTGGRTFQRASEVLKAVLSVRVT